VPSKKRTVYLDRLEELNVKIAEKSLEYVKYITNNKDKKTVGETLFLFKNYTNRCDLFDESHYRQVLDVLTEKISSGQVTTHSVKEICSAITTTRMNMANPSLMNAIIQFFMSRPDPKELHINILYKSVIACSRTGHELPPEFLDVVSHCLNRDIDSVPGLLSLQVAQAICTYGDPGRELITSLFSNEFMQKLDNEVQMSGDRNNYPRLVRSNLMELNRAVVLRYPQYGVPWFHQKYCLENHQQMLGNNGTKSSNESFVLRQEVYEHLCSVLNGWRFVKEDVTSRYFNNIDFEVAYDHNGRPVDLISNPNLEPAKRIAVMVLPTTSYTVDTKQIMNKERVLMRELELEGWNVIIVDPFIWNSMQLTESSAKRNYLLTCLNDVMGPELKTQTRSYP